MTDRDERTILELVDIDNDTLTVFKNTHAVTNIEGLLLMVNEQLNDSMSPGENCVILDEEMVRKLTSAMLTWLHTGDGS